MIHPILGCIHLRVSLFDCLILLRDAGTIAHQICTEGLGFFCMLPAIISCKQTKAEVLETQCETELFSHSIVSQYVAAEIVYLTR